MDAANQRRLLQAMPALGSRTELAQELMACFLLHLPVQIVSIAVLIASKFTFRSPCAAQSMDDVLF